MTRSHLLIAVFVLLLLGLIYPIGLLFQQGNLSDPRFSIQDLGVIDTGNWVHLNNRGHVAFTHLGPQGQVSVLWTPEAGRREISGVAVGMHVHGLSDRDVVVGARNAWSEEDATQGHPRACVWSATEGLVELPVENALKSWAFHLHEDGRILGMTEREDGSKNLVIWTEGGVIKEASPDAFWNSTDHRADWITETPDGFEDYTTEMVGKGHVFFSHGTDGERVVGGIAYHPSFHQRVTRFIRTSNNPLMVFLADVLGSVGLMAGPKELRSAFLWEDEESIDLHRLIEKGSGWDHLVQANGVNERGQIVGLGIKGGSQRLFLLTPLGEDR